MVVSGGASDNFRAKRRAIPKIEGGRGPHISGWIFQKVLAETAQKGLILSQKALISNRCNFGMFAPKLTRFPSKGSKSKDLSF